MKIRTLVALTVATAFSQGVLAQAKAPEAAMMAASAPGKAAMAGTVKVSAVVVAIDAASRTLTLKGAKGKIVDVNVPPEAKNFDEIRIGDTVTVEYARALTLELKPTGSIRSRTSESASAPAPAGAVAGGAAAKQVVIMANVTAINAKEGYVTLRGPKGNSVDLAVPDPKQLKRIKVGDQVEAVYTEALAITVDRTPKAK
jgi:Cu/Ag efflux protein CusF